MHGAALGHARSAVGDRPGLLAKRRTEAIGGDGDARELGLGRLGRGESTIIGTEAEREGEALRTVRDAAPR